MAQPHHLSANNLLIFNFYRTPHPGWCGWSLSTILHHIVMRRIGPAAHFSPCRRAGLYPRIGTRSQIAPMVRMS